MIADCKRSEEDLNQTIANLPKQVDEVNDRIMQMFDKGTTQMMAELDNFKAEEMNRLDETDKASSKVNDCIHEIIPVSSALDEHGTLQQKYIVTKIIKDTITNIENNLTEQQNKDITSAVSLVFTEKLSSLLTYQEDIVKLNTERHLTHIDVVTMSPANIQQSSDINKGNLDSNKDVVTMSTANIQQSSDINKGNPDSNKGSSSDIALPAPIKPVTLELLVSVDLKQTGYDKKEPVITGLDFFPDGRLVAVDNINWKCTILTDRLQRLGTSYIFNKYPFEVVCLSQSDIAVTMCEKSVCLLTVSLDDNIYLIIEIKMSSNVFSTCCMTPQTMVVSTYDDPRPVRLLSLDGEETDFDPAVVPKTYKLGESKITYVTSNNTLVLTDRFAHKVYMYNTITGTSREVTDENLQEPRGACAGPCNTVLVCSRLKNSIVHLTVDGDILGSYPVDMNFPYNICMNKEGTRLALSGGDSGNKKMLLYKINYNMP